MLRRLPILLAAVCTALIAWGPALAAEAVFPKGSQIGLTPPGDLKPSTRFPGFEDPDRKVTISLLQLPMAAYENVERSIFAKNQAGLTDVKRESFPFQSGIGFLVTGRGQENGVGVHKWFLAATGLGPQFPDLAMLIKVDVPEAASAVYPDAAIRKALASVTFRSPPIDEQLSLLPIKFRELAGFRVMRVVANDGAILIEGPSQDMIKNPYMIISLARGGPENPDDRARFARELLSSRAAARHCRDFRRGHAHRRPAGLRSARNRNGLRRQTAGAGAMAALRRRRLPAHHRRGAPRKLGSAFPALSRRARRHRLE